MNKKVIIGLGVLAVAGIGYYMWKNKKSAKSRVSNSDVKSATPPSEMGASQEESNSGDSESNFWGWDSKKKKITTNNPMNDIVPMPPSGVCPRGSSPVNVSAPNQIPDIRCNYGMVKASPNLYM